MKDFVELEDEEPADAFDAIKDEGTGEAPEEGAAQPDEVERDDLTFAGEEAPAEHETAPETEAQAEPEPPAVEAKTEDPVASLRAMVDQQNQMLAALHQQVEMLRQHRPEDPKAPPKQPEPEPFQPPTDEEWAENPTLASQKLAAAEVRKALLQERAEREKMARAQREQSELRSRQIASAQQAVAVVPELVDENSVQRRHYNAIINHPENRLKDHPNGPYLAALSVRDFMARQEQQTGDLPTAAGTGDAARADRLKKQTMHAGGKQRTNNVIRLSQEQDKARRELGLSKDAYIEGLKAAGMAK